MGVRMLKLLLGAVTSQGKKTHREYRPTLVSATQPKQRHWFVDAVGFVMYLAENEQHGASYWDFGALRALIRDVLATLVRAGIVVHLFFDALSEGEPAVAASTASLDAFHAVAEDSSSSSTSAAGSSSSASPATIVSPAEARPVKVNRAQKNVADLKPLGLRRTMLDAIREAVAEHPAQLTLAVTQDEAERELMRELQRSNLGKDQALILSNDSDIFLCRSARRGPAWPCLALLGALRFSSLARSLLTSLARPTSPRKEHRARGGVAPTGREPLHRGLQQWRGEVPVRQLRVLGRKVPRPRARAPAGPRAGAGLQ